MTAAPTVSGSRSRSGKEKQQWQIDVTFLASHYRCIFGQGCQGVLTEPAPELVHGCCSYGAHASDKKDRLKIERLAKKLGDDEWQFKKRGMQRGVWKSVGKDDYRTRLVDGACIFLNRPGFRPARAARCTSTPTAPASTSARPSRRSAGSCRCRAVNRDEEDESITTILTEFGRDGWGEGGEEFCWWCTEAKEAYSAPIPVYKTMEPELRHMLGDDVYEQVAKYLRRASLRRPADAASRGGTGEPRAHVDPEAVSRP